MSVGILGIIVCLSFYKDTMQHSPALFFGGVISLKLATEFCEDIKKLVQPFLKDEITVTTSEVISGAVKKDIIIIRPLTYYSPQPTTMVIVDSPGEEKNKKKTDEDSAQKVVVPEYNRYQLYQKTEKNYKDFRELLLTVDGISHTFDSANTRIFCEIVSQWRAVRKEIWYDIMHNGITKSAGALGITIAGISAILGSSVGVIGGALLTGLTAVVYIWKGNTTRKTNELMKKIFTDVNTFIM